MRPVLPRILRALRCWRTSPWQPLAHLAIRILGLFACTIGCASPAARPNIVWIVAEDMSPHFGCYGDRAVATPNVDRLAASGTRFASAFVTGPICSISRSALITGCYQTAIGAQNHRSGSSRFPIPLPEGVALVPERMKQSGYHVSNLSFADFLRRPGMGRGEAKVLVAKTDYNFVWDPASTYDTTHWTARAGGQPFFLQVQLGGGKHRGQAPGSQWPARVQAALGSVTAPGSVVLPPYLPDDPVIRADWAQYLDTVRYTDWEVGQILARLREAGELERTVVVFMTDHGISHVRNKQFLYDGGTHVALVMAGPGIPRGRVRRDLVEHIDLAATTLALAGVARPGRMQGQDLFARRFQPRKFVFGARDRADETVDRIRSVRSARWKYIRNFYPSRPYLQPNRYKDDKAIVQAMRRLHEEGRLNADQAKILAETRPREELYDLAKDPFELRNLATEPACKQVLVEHRKQLEAWMQRTDDRGRMAEPQDVYLNFARTDRPEAGRNPANEVLERNIQLMLRWAGERPMEGGSP
jgi:arylsulfatase A-like enzyme